MLDEDYAHWIAPDGKPYTKDSMKEEAIRRFSVLLDHVHSNTSYPQDGSKGQAKAFTACLLASLKG
jgi:hypothetical protein